MSETKYTIEITNKQMASISLLSAEYLALVMANRGIDPITSEKIDLQVVLAAAEVIDIFNKAIGTPDGYFPELIEQLRKMITEGKGKDWRVR